MTLRQLSYLEKVCCGLGQLARKKFKAVLVETALEMGFHFFLVE